MTRVTWLQRRSALISLVALYAGCAIAILVGDLQIHASYASYVANGCVAHPFHVPCGTTFATFQRTQDAFSALVIALNALPVIVGVFVGAPLLSREFESGTFRFTWTQAVGRTRYVLVTLALLTGVVITAGTLLGLLLSTWAHPFDVIGTENQWYSGQFAVTWFLLVAWSLFALALGVCLGAAIKRTVTAMAVTTALAGGLSVASFVVIVHRLLAIAPLVSTKISPLGLGVGTLNQPANAWQGQQPPGAWLVRSWFTGPNGHVLGRVPANRLLNQLNGAKSGRSVNPISFLSLRHAAFWVSYQPASRFWVFQGVTGLILIAVAAVLVVVTVRIVTERVGRGSLLRAHQR